MKFIKLCDDEAECGWKEIKKRSFKQAKDGEREQERGAERGRDYT